MGKLPEMTLCFPRNADNGPPPIDGHVCCHFKPISLVYRQVRMIHRILQLLIHELSEAIHIGLIGLKMASKGISCWPFIQLCTYIPGLQPSLMITHMISLNPLTLTQFRFTSQSVEGSTTKLDHTTLTSRG